VAVYDPDAGRLQPGWIDLGGRQTGEQPEIGGSQQAAKHN
jgi:hypothetical protein